MVLRHPSSFQRHLLIWKKKNLKQNRIQLRISFSLDFIWIHFHNSTNSVWLFSMLKHLTKEKEKAKSPKFVSSGWNVHLWSNERRSRGICFSLPFKSVPTDRRTDGRLLSWTSWISVRFFFFFMLINSNLSVDLRSSEQSTVSFFLFDVIEI